MARCARLGLPSHLAFVRNCISVNALIILDTNPNESSTSHQWGYVFDIIKHIPSTQTDPQGLIRPPDRGAQPLSMYVDTSCTALEHDICSLCITGSCQYSYLNRKEVSLARTTEEGCGDLRNTVRRGLMKNNGDTHICCEI